MMEIQEHRGEECSTQYCVTAASCSIEHGSLKQSRPYGGKASLPNMGRECASEAATERKIGYRDNAASKRAQSMRQFPDEALRKIQRDYDTTVTSAKTDSLRRRHSKELSVIEESIFSGDSQSQSASFFSGGVEKFVRSIASQTDYSLLEQFIEGIKKQPFMKRSFSQRIIAVADASLGINPSATTTAAIHPRRVKNDKKAPNRRSKTFDESPISSSLLTEEESPDYRRSLDHSQSPLIRRRKRSNGEKGSAKRRSPTESESSETEPKPPSGQKKTALGTGGQFSDVFVKSVGGAFTTFLGPAVQLNEGQEFYMTEEENTPEEFNMTPHDDQKAKNIGIRLESAAEALLPAILSANVRKELGKVHSPVSADSHDSRSSETSSSPKLQGDRRDSMFTRFGKNMKKRFSQSPEECIQSPESAEGVPYDITEETEEPSYSGATNLTRKYSDAADSGVESGVIAKGGRYSISGQGMSLDSSGYSRSDFDTDSSKHSSAKSKPGNSIRMKSIQEPIAALAAGAIKPPTSLELKIKDDSWEFSQLLDEMTESTLV